jgi:hypothetical protein
VDRGLGYGAIRIHIARIIGVWRARHAPLLSPPATSKFQPLTLSFFFTVVTTGRVVEKRQVNFYPIWGYIDPFWEYKKQKISIFPNLYVKLKVYLSF